MQDNLERGVDGELLKQAKKDVAKKDGYHMGIDMQGDDSNKDLEQLIMEGKVREAVVNRDKYGQVPLSQLSEVNAKDKI